MKKVFTSTLVMIFFAAGAFAFDVDFSRTMALAVVGNNLYTIDQRGSLFRTDLATGKSVQIGGPDFGNALQMFAAGGALFTLDRDGNLYRINPVDGAWSLIGKAGNRRRARFGTGAGDKGYVIESQGEIFEVDPASGGWRPITEPDFIGTRYFLGDKQSLYTIDGFGDIRAVSLTNGASRRVGNSNDWVNTKLAAVLGGKIYTIETDGALYVTDPQTATWRQIGKKDFGRVKFLFAAGTTLYIIEHDDQGLHRVNPADGIRTKVGS